MICKLNGYAKALSVYTGTQSWLYSDMLAWCKHYSRFDDVYNQAYHQKP